MAFLNHFVLERLSRKGRVPMAGVLLLLHWTFPAQVIGNPSAITDVHGDGKMLSVTVSVPAGKRRVTLETRPRATSGAWIPRQVRWTDGTTNALVFQLPMSSGLELVRAREETEQEMGLNASFFTGSSRFAPSVLSQPPANPASDGPQLTSLGPDVAVGPSRAVVESDIWKIDGNAIYFYNQARGFQVIDVTDLDHPVLTGTLGLGTLGEQMYQLPSGGSDGSTWLALLSQSSCDYNSSEITLVRVTNGIPRRAGTIPIQGRLQESRLVGDVLYVASSGWSSHQADPSSPPVWSWNTSIQSVDLSSPESPVPSKPMVLPVNADTILATDQFLLVATSGTEQVNQGPLTAPWRLSGNHAVLIFDLSDPHGAISQLGYVLTTGRAGNKFNLALEDNLLTVVSEKPGGGHWQGGDTNKPGFGFWVWDPPETVLETFDVGHPANPSHLATLPLVTNESLYASRIEGGRAYVVTFQRRDPLWLIDLSDPVHPAIRGKLDLPGYSTYLQTLSKSTRLMALGADAGQTTLQLFDIADLSKPSLMSKVALGSGWSWSEGNWDEKAFRVYPDAGLSLVPWQGNVMENGTNRWFSGVQLIDFDIKSGTLTPRGVIEDASTVRRAQVVRDHVVSISSSSLAVADIADRDHPNRTGQARLSRQIDRVLISGHQLIEITDGRSGEPPRIQLCDSSFPDTALVSLLPGSLPITGASLHAGYLHLLQQSTPQWTNQWVTRTNVVRMDTSSPPYFFEKTVVTSGWESVQLPRWLQLSVVSVSSNQLHWIGQTTSTNSLVDDGGNLSAHWLNDGAVVWAASNPTRYWPGYYPIGIAIDFVPIRFWGGGSGSWLLAFDVNDPSAPRLKSESKVDIFANSLDSSEVFTSDSKLYRTTSTYFSGNFWQYRFWNPTGSLMWPGNGNEWLWVGTNQLTVVDFADLSLPAVRDPISVPGKLVGVAARGQLLHLTGPNATNTTDSGTYLHVAAYDGVQVNLVSSKALPDAGLQWKALPDGRLIGALPSLTSKGGATLARWSVGSDGTWQQTPGIELPSMPEDIELYGSVAVISLSDSYHVVEASDPVDLKPLGWAERPCWFYLDPTTSDLSLSLGLWVGRGGAEPLNLPIIP